MKPELSIIIPCRNEEKYIQKIIENIIIHNQDMSFEIIVVDGMSTDRTREIVREFEKMYPDIVRLIDNPAKYVPHALNLGIKHARGDILIRMDAHAIYPTDYVKKLVEWLKKTDAWNVGPVVEPVPAGNSAIQKAIAVAQKSLFGVGNSLWRMGVNKPTYADTTWCFCMKKETFKQVGEFNEKLIRNQDAEFNARIIKNGGKNLVVPDVRVKLIARGNLKGVAKQYFQYGYYRALSAKILKKIFSIRQFIPPIFFSILLFTLLLAVKFTIAAYLFVFLLASYTAGSVLFAAYESIKHKSIALLFTLPLTYLIIHSAFATGFLYGYFRFFILKKKN